MTLALVLGIAFGADRVAQSVMSLPVFQFSKLELSGNLTRVPIDRVKEVVEPMLKGNYFTEDLEAVRAAVETVPWVSRATVRRVWSNELHVEVEIYRSTWRSMRMVDWWTPMVFYFRQTLMSAITRQKHSLIFMACDADSTNCALLP